MVNRLGIYVFYDPEAIVKEYVEDILINLSVIWSNLIIVVNGEIKDEELVKLKKYTKEIYIRENVGFDAGAYKDVFLKYYPMDDWRKWDEIILINNSFYGSFYSWEKIFSEMQNSDVDFWGLSEYTSGGITLGDDKDTPNHVQSYFIVIKKSLFLKSEFINFWKKMNYPISFSEAIKEFEIKFSLYFKNLGCNYTTWLEKQNFELTLNEGETVYSKYPLELIRDYNFPILKKKAIYAKDIVDAVKICKYIENINRKAANYIIEDYMKNGNAEYIYMFSRFKLEEFCKMHNKIYIYGAGKIGNKIAEYLEYKKLRYEGFIVSKIEDSETKKGCIREFKSLKREKDMGIILALGKNSFEEVYPIIRDNYNKSQLLLQEYILDN